MSTSTTTPPIYRGLLLCLGAGLSLVVACEDPVLVEPPPQPAQNQPQVPEGGTNQAPTGSNGVEPVGEEEAYTRPEFPPGRRRDPFSFLPPEPEIQEAKAIRIKEPLESYDIGQLRLLAIVTGTAIPTAMFADPTGFGHFAKEDDRIGRNGGRITDIRTNEVEITINAEGALSSAEDIEDRQPDERGPAEPVTLVIRLSDTDIRPPSELEEEEGGSVLDKIEEKPGGEAPQEPTSPLAP